MTVEDARAARWCQAVGDRAEAAHRQSLFDLEQKYGDVVGLNEAVDYLATRVRQPQAVEQRA